jgi:CRP-like cAMP-binding protein
MNTAERITPHCLSDRPTGVVCVDYPDQAVVYSGAAAPTHTWVVESGYIKLHRVSMQGKQATMALLGRGAVVGSIAEHPDGWGETASAQGKVRAYRIETSALERLLATDTEFARFVTRSLSRRQAALQRRLYYVMHRKVEARLAAVLRDLVQGEGEACVHGGDVDVRLTQQDLADMIGASRQMVSTTLNEFRERKMVDYSRDFICVGNLRALADVAES